MNKHNLDKLFQEKFKDLDTLPDASVWESIEASLDKKKKKRRVVPMWWSLGGVAAALVIGLLVFNPFGKTTNQDTIDTNNIPVITDVNTDSLHKDANKRNTKETINKETVVPGTSENGIANTEQETDNTNGSIKETSPMKQSAITTNTDTPYIRTENQGKHTPVKSVNQTPKNEAVVSTSDTKETVGDKGKNTSFNTDITKGSDVRC